MNVDGSKTIIGDCDHAEFPGITSELRPIDHFRDNNDDNSTADEKRVWKEQCCPATITDRCNVPRCDANADGTLAPVQLNAWVANTPEATRDATDVVEGLAKEEPVPVLLSEVKDPETKKVLFAGADALAKEGKTPFFRGRFRVARENETADLVVSKDEDISKPLWISYGELMLAQAGKVETSPGYPDCDALEKAANSGKKEESDTVRLKIVALESSCVPFLMPKACCE
jgi:hypothetical protein